MGKTGSCAAYSCFPRCRPLAEWLISFRTALRLLVSESKTTKACRRSRRAFSFSRWGKQDHALHTPVFPDAGHSQRGFLYIEQACKLAYKGRDGNEKINPIRVDFFCISGGGNHRWKNHRHWFLDLPFCVWDIYRMECSLSRNRPWCCSYGAGIFLVLTLTTINPNFPRFVEKMGYRVTFFTSLYKD